MARFFNSGSVKSTWCMLSFISLSQTFSCSASCGKGFRNRPVSCVTGSGLPLPEEDCRLRPEPARQRRCRGSRCPKWKTGGWAECSATCGTGTQRREVSCRLGNRRSPDETECSQRSRPASGQPCSVTECPSLYQWREEEWQPCSKSCGTGHRRRALQCVDQLGKEVHDMFCASQVRAPDSEPCNGHPCDFVWVTGDWTDCSASCGEGFRRRLVSCSEVHSGNSDNYEYGHQSSSNCPGTPPESYSPCTVGPCLAPQEWRAGTWGPCSVSCGAGLMERNLQCETADGQQVTRCSPDAMPERRKVCSNLDCHLPVSCRDVQRLHGRVPDGEHFLRIHGKALKVYCAGLQTDTPQEYLTLTAGERENFSEVFGFRLIDPTQCPANGSIREDCECRKDYSAAGLSAFSKVRLDLSKMHIITTDWQFASTHEGQRVPFATAGDCFSAARCPQGQFRVNLSGTGLQVAQGAHWITQGNYAVAEISRSEDGSRVTGMCGGYCGTCTPSSSSLAVILE